jgi:DNA-binding CsgD family transcriptional regulator
MNNHQFRYFLKGFDEAFGAWTNATTKEYTNLQEGNYEFVAQSRNYMGEIVSSQVFRLKVNPPLYRSKAAKVCYAAGSLLLLVLVSRFQKRRYKQKAIQLENEKQMALAQKQQKLIEVEQQKEKELLQLKEEKMQSELQHVNKLLAASTMNLVVKNEFIESIREELKVVKQKGKKLETKQALEKIVKEIDISLRLEQDWEQFEYHFDQIHGDFLTRLRNDYPDLSPNEQKLCAFLRLNLNTKEIANLLSISLRGVEVARYRLRKKLGLERGQNLSKYILEY